MLHWPALTAQWLRNELFPRFLCSLQNTGINFIFPYPRYVLSKFLNVGHFSASRTLKWKSSYTKKSEHERLYSQKWTPFTGSQNNTHAHNWEWMQSFCVSLTLPSNGQNRLQPTLSKRCLFCGTRMYSIQQSNKNVWVFAVHNEQK